MKSTLPFWVAKVMVLVLSSAPGALLRAFGGKQYTRNANGPAEAEAVRRRTQERETRPLRVYGHIFVPQNLGLGQHLVVGKGALPSSSRFATDWDKNSLHQRVCVRSE